LPDVNLIAFVMQIVQSFSDGAMLVIFCIKSLYFWIFCMFTVLHYSKIDSKVGEKISCVCCYWKALSVCQIKQGVWEEGRTMFLLNVMSLLFDYFYVKHFKLHLMPEKCYINKVYYYYYSESSQTDSTAKANASILHLTRCFEISSWWFFSWLNFLIYLFY